MSAFAAVTHFSIFITTLLIVGLALLPFVIEPLVRLVSLSTEGFHPLKFIAAYMTSMFLWRGLYWFLDRVLAPFLRGKSLWQELMESFKWRRVG